jgi:hypothetical protein
MSVSTFTGWFLTVVGLPITTVFALFTPFYLGRGPYAVIIAVYLTGPICLTAAAVTMLGNYLRNRKASTRRVPCSSAGTGALQ